MFFREIILFFLREWWSNLWLCSL